MLTTFADGVVTVGVSALLIRLVGLEGAPLGSLAGVLLVSLPLNLAGLARSLGTTVFQVAAPLWPWFWRFAVLAVVLGGVGYYAELDRFFRLAGATLGVAAVYLLVMLPVLTTAPLAERLQPLWLRVRNRVLGRAS
jgi:hypothetical protein